MGQADLVSLLRVIASGDAAQVMQRLQRWPELATAQVDAKHGASRQNAASAFIVEIRHYYYAGDTALHLAAATYATELVEQLVRLGADVGARNRRGATPLHYAVDGGPRAPHWNPRAQAATVRMLVENGADANATDKSGVAPLHRAVRNRCAAAVSALLDNGADPRRRNKNGSTPLQLAQLTTGKSGSGSPEAKAEQTEILRLLRAR
jgi:hypothetical protein